MLGRRTSQAPSAFSGRILVLGAFFFVFSGVIIFRLFGMQVLQHSFYVALASQSQEVYRDLLPERGSIYVREQGELYPLVTNRDYYNVYAEPNKISSPQKVIDAIVPILKLTEEEWKPMVPKLAKSDDPYEPIKRKVSQEQIEQLGKLAVDGIGWVSESYRYYPERNLGGHLFGFVGQSDGRRIGQYGLEGYFNDELTGKSGLEHSVKDALGALITIGPRSIQKAQNGDDLVLTIDRQIQFMACSKLKEFYDWYEAEQGSVIVLNPKTGAVLAMCNFPDFDPEQYGEVQNIDYFNNPSTFYGYEPGSVMKSITMAAALDQGKVTPATTYQDTGEVKVGPYTIRNFDRQTYGEQTMTQVLAQSLNLGAMFAAEQIGGGVLRDYIEAFGFGKATGIELDSESAGDIASLSKRGDVYYLTASFGQGITVTPLQLAAAYAAVANNGILMQPHVVAERISHDGGTTVIQPKEVRRVLQPKTATILTGMLTEVVESSYDRKARVPGYYLAAKTGTAQVSSPTGGYSNQTIHTIVGYGPVTDPRFVILVKIDKLKQGPTYASDSVGPLFSQLARSILDYYQIPPDY